MSDTTESLLSFFSISRLSSRLSSSSHVLVQERRLVPLCGRTSSAVAPVTRPVSMALVVRGSTEVLVPQVRVHLAHLVLCVQMTREMAEPEMEMMMSDLSDQMQLVAPLCA